MRRSTFFTILFGVLATAVPLRGEVSSSRLGLELREAIAFDAATMAALEVGISTYTSIASIATDYCNTQRATIEPLLAAVRTARQNLLLANESGDDPTIAERALQDTLTAVAAATTSVRADMDALLTTDQQTRRPRVMEDRSLEATVALLDLSNSQRAELHAIQRARDAALRHHRNRTSPDKLRQARTEYESAVAAVLTADQRASRQPMVAALATNIKALRALDATLRR